MRAEQPVIFWTLILTVALAPLPFASVYVWSWSLLACIVSALVSAWSVRVIVGAQKAAFGLRATWPFLLPFAVVAGWTALQAIPWTPTAWHHPLWESAGRAVNLPLAGRISLNPDETLSALTRLLAYAGIFWLALQYSRRTQRAEQIFHVIIAAGVIYGLFALLQKWLGWQSRLGLPGTEDGWGSGGGAQDHSFGAYVSLALICTSSFILSAGATPPRRLGLRDFCRRLVDGSIASRRLLGTWLILLAMVPWFGFREDAMSLWLALAVLVVLALIGKLARGPRLLVFALASVLVVLAVGTVRDYANPGPAPQPAAAEQREQLQALAQDAMSDAPILGTGAGTFEEVLRFYRTSEFDGTPIHAPSSYHEAVLELGAIAAGALFLLFAAFGLFTGAGALRRQRDSAYGAAGFAATVLIAAHAAFDCSLKVPAVAATYSLLIGAACAQSWSSRREDDAW